MADRYWTGTTDGVVSTATNFSGGVAPTAGDSVYAITAPSNAMASGTFPNLVTFEVKSIYGANGIGTSAGAVVFGDVTTMKIGARGGAYYLAPTGTVTTAHFEPSNSGEFVISNGTWTTTYATACKVTWGASAVVTNFFPNGAEGSFATNATDMTLYEGVGNFTFNSRDIDDAVVDGGVLTLKGTSALDAVVKVGPQGTFAHQSSGTVAAARVKPGGVYTVVDNPSQSATLTTAQVWKGGTLIEAAPGFVLTITNRVLVGGSSVAGGAGS